MRDYFAALAARTLQPELGLHPRHRVRWEDVAEPPVDPFAAMSGEASVRDGRRNELAEGQRVPRSNRRSSVVAEPSGNEPVTPRSERDHPVRARTTGHDETAIAASAVPRVAARSAEPAAQIRSGQPEAGAVHTPASRTPASADVRSSTVVASHGTERAFHVPTRISVRGREPAASEPAIRIRIGRVDVRAITAAVAPAPADPRESKRALMSLDEYVQKRDRGVS